MAEVLHAERRAFAIEHGQHFALEAAEVRIHHVERHLLGVEAAAVLRRHLMRPQVDERVLVADLVRAEGLEPPRAVKLRGFSYRLRLSPPRRAGRVCGLDYPFTVPGGAGGRCCPSSLYTFPAGRLRPGLARDRHVTGFPEFGQFCIAGFPASTQVCA